MSSKRYQFVSLTALVAFILSMIGCSQPQPTAFKLNAVELLKQEKLFLDDDESFPSSFAVEVGTILTAVFGTPDSPRVPEAYSKHDPAVEVMTLENLTRAAGPVSEKLGGTNGQVAGLYLAHCADCHGVTGDGAGPNARSLNPYPRDYRLGKFKYKSTPSRAAPTDDDLKQVLLNGIPGTAMPSFRTLPEDDIEALIDYVKYLSIRGQYERYLLGELSNLDDGERLIDLTYPRTKMIHGESGADGMNGDATKTSDDPAKEIYLDSMRSRIQEALVEGIVARWIRSTDKITDVPAAPQSISSAHPDHQRLVDQGRALFHKEGNCVQCHGETAVGNGQTESFDDWTNDWIKTPGVDPMVPETYADFNRAGALPPRPILPRNLTENVYRGGGKPDKIYLRIANGIEGTPMPAATTLKPDEIWALVAYVKSLP